MIPQGFFFGGPDGMFWVTPASDTGSSDVPVQFIAVEAPPADWWRKLYAVNCPHGTAGAQVRAPVPDVDVARRLVRLHYGQLQCACTRELRERYGEGR